MQRFPEKGLLRLTDRGLYCAEADVFIDPWRPVRRAIITHGHSDHARPGMGEYLCTPLTLPVLRHRLGEGIRAKVREYGRELRIRGVGFTFFPAGHIPGSAQVRVRYRGETWVVSGDYKTEADGISTPFEPVRCHTFITESTFGLPVYRWEPSAMIHSRIEQWWAQCRQDGRQALLCCYALGKAQRVLSSLRVRPGRVYVHPAIAQIQEVLEQEGLPPVEYSAFPASGSPEAGSLILCPPGALGSTWVKRCGEVSLGMASGWMTLRGPRRRQAFDRGFALSDHADWPGLLTAIQATGAENIWATHGYTEVLSRWLSEQGYCSGVLTTPFGEEEGQANNPAV